MRYARVSTCMTAAGALLVLVQLASQLTGAELGTDSCVEIDHLPTVASGSARRGVVSFKYAMLVGDCGADCR